MLIDPTLVRDMCLTWRVLAVRPRSRNLFDILLSHNIQTPPSAFTDIASSVCKHPGLSPYAHLQSLEPTRTDQAFKDLTPDPWNEVQYQPEDSTVPRVSECRTKESTEPIHVWLQERPAVLDELIKLEGRGCVEHWATCQCGRQDPIYRCRECFTVYFLCKECIVQLHLNHPLHHIEHWTNGYLIRTTLKHLGLRIQLGHKPGETCPNRQPAYDDDFVVIDVHAVHAVALDFCGCERAACHYKQLLRARWFLATIKEPRTAGTFAVMEHFHILSLKSKVTAYEFFHTLARQTDNTGLTPIRDHYAVFLKMASGWRNIKAFKRAGRGHDPGGINTTKAGELAVLCPTCPQPGRNLPPGWENSEQG
ncbi:hypothetical protein JVT61DRAFT_6151 [Boletus reticuloceps]|uniref:CxC2-like cysteine cluster KDZ transposase-associated domain-containing protein n=1 Tax=Boletus reticuloceps TaxID=495285 RepID=A0A8I2YKH6_9AGAM|nr:hypothetical protein JVT61DRAFT_6151 [Boletus reticuloceps]